MKVASKRGLAMAFECNGVNSKAERTSVESEGSKQPISALEQILGRKRFPDCRDTDPEVYRHPRAVRGVRNSVVPHLVAPEPQRLAPVHLARGIVPHPWVGLDKESVCSKDLGYRDPKVNLMTPSRRRRRSFAKMSVQRKY